MFDPGDASYHQFSGGWVLADLADAAVHGDGDLAYVASVVSDWRRVAAERARRELRASGETVPRRAPDTWDQLSPQELQIAQLAAAGLSNKEIGERLYLSHRTVGTHLYRLFPKLGVTSRTELSAALQAGTGTGAGRLAGD